MINFERVAFQIGQKLYKNGQKLSFLPVKIISQLSKWQAQWVLAKALHTITKLLLLKLGCWLFVIHFKNLKCKTQDFLIIIHWIAYFHILFVPLLFFRIWCSQSSSSILNVQYVAMIKHSLHKYTALWKTKHSIVHSTCLLVWIGPAGINTKGNVQQFI